MELKGNIKDYTLNRFIEEVGVSKTSMVRYLKNININKFSYFKNVMYEEYMHAEVDMKKMKKALALLLAVPLVFCLLVELLNSAIENVVDRVSLEWHPLAKKAKDMGSAAQFTAQIFLAAVWVTYLLGRLSSL